MTRLLLTAASVLALTVGAANAQSSSTIGSSKSLSNSPTTLSNDCDTVGKSSAQAKDPNSNEGVLGMNGAAGASGSAGTTSTACPPGSGSSTAPSVSHGANGSTDGANSSSSGMNNDR